MTPKVTFEDWESGKAVHISCVIYNAQLADIIMFDWHEVVETDIEKIRFHQKEIAIEKKNQLVENWTKFFEEKMKDYDRPQLFLSNEIHDFKTILQIDESQKVIIDTYNPNCVYLNHKSFQFKDIDLLEFRNYTHDVLITKKKGKYDFIPSANFLYVNDNKTIDEIYTEAMFDYYNYLVELQINSKYINSLSQLFIENDHKYKIVKDAILDLNIVSTLSNYQLTAFVNGSIDVGVFPKQNVLFLLKLVYNEIGKEIPKDLKARKGTVAYHEMYKSTMDYYNGIKKSGKY